MATNHFLVPESNTKPKKKILVNGNKSDVYSNVFPRTIGQMQKSNNPIEYIIRRLKFSEEI